MPIRRAIATDIKAWPLHGVKKPTAEQIGAALAILDCSGVVFVHCEHGEDRTGAVVACYRIKHGWSNKKALNEAEFYHINPLQIFIRDFIESYKPQE